MTTCAVSSSNADNVFTIYKNESKTLEVTVKQNGQKVDIDGAEVHFTVRTRADATDAAIDLDSVNDPSQVYVMTPQTDPDKKGKLQIKLISANTTSLTAAKYIYDVWIILSGDKNIVIPPTQMVLSQPVTLLP